MKARSRILRPTFRLRTALLAVIVLSVPLAWVAYSLNWIRERHVALAYFSELELYFLGEPPYDEPPARAPGLLWVFGEPPLCYAFWRAGPVHPGMVPAEEWERLFPEAGPSYPLGEYDAERAKRPFDYDIPFPSTGRNGMRPK